MKTPTILVSPDSFKGTFSSADVINHITQGINHLGGEAIPCPVADGGEGTTDALSHALAPRKVCIRSHNPWGSPITAEFGLTDNGIALVDLASASGLTLVHDGERDPMAASTYGTGELIAAAISHGAHTVLIAAGGSATTDGGTGAIEAIEKSGGVRDTQLVVLSDVRTPFEQAAEVFGRQKGANDKEIEALTARLKQQATAFPKNPLGVPRTGAAGGFSGGMWAQYDAQLVSGAEFVLDTIGFEQLLETVDAVVVGEGRLDSQTGEGKIIDSILGRVAMQRPQLPIFAVVGSIDKNLGSYAENFSQVIVASTSLDLKLAGEQIVKILKLS